MGKLTLEGIEMELNGVKYVRKDSINNQQQLPPKVEELNNINDLVGLNLFIQTVTYHAVGHVDKIFNEDTLILSNTYRVFQSGSLVDCFGGKIKNKEPIKGIHNIKWDAITDYTIWEGDL